jgi:hypothetical protein
VIGSSSLLFFLESVGEEHGIEAERGEQGSVGR